MSTTALTMLHITSCRDPLMWYSDRVGQFVPLLRRLPEGGWGSQEPDGLRNIVKRLDAEEVTVFVSRPKLGQWPYIEPVHKLLYMTPKDVVDRVRAGAPPEPPTGERVAWPPGTGPAPTCKDRCDTLGVCHSLHDCEDALCTARAVSLPPPRTGQSRRASMAETVANLVIGFVVSVLITAAVLPLYGHAVTLSENIEITAIFTAASLLRGYGLRRLFNLLTHRT